jgi:hypothetical protein
MAMPINTGPSSNPNMADLTKYVTFKYAKRDEPDGYTPLSKTYNSEILRDYDDWVIINLRR